MSGTPSAAKRSGKRSAGLLMFRGTAEAPEFFLVHPGGPLFRRKDLGCWSIPKGRVEEGEDELAAARREFAEETGLEAPAELFPIGDVRQRSGKVVRAWAFRTSIAGAPVVRSNMFELEWPPRSGHQRKFPEIDRGEFFSLDEARRKIIPAQEPFLDRVLAELRREGAGSC